MASEGDLPELATNEEWRGIMRRARLEPRDDYPKGMTQGELAKKVGTSQVMISNLESGAASSSKYVLPICNVLGIPLPEHFTDEVERAWAQLGRVIRAKGLEQQKAATKVVMALAGITDDDLRAAGLLPPIDDEPEKPKKSK